LGTIIGLKTLINPLRPFNFLIFGKEEEPGNSGFGLKTEEEGTYPSLNWGLNY